MEETILNALTRSIPPKKFREKGFIPGVLYGDNITNGTTVKFEASALKKVISQHGSSAKVWVNYGSKKRFGFIKEVQKHPVEKNITHIDVQIVSQNSEMKIHLPIVFRGRESLEQKKLLLNITKSDVEVLGLATLMPDVVTIDVSEKELGDSLTMQDFLLDSQIKVLDRNDEIYGVITYVREQPVEEVETTASEATEETAE